MKWASLSFVSLVWWLNNQLFYLICWLIYVLNDWLMKQLIHLYLTNLINKENYFNHLSKKWKRLRTCIDEKTPKGQTKHLKRQLYQWLEYPLQMSCWRQKLFGCPKQCCFNVKTCEMFWNFAVSLWSGNHSLNGLLRLSILYSTYWWRIPSLEQRFAASKKRSMVFFFIQMNK